MKMDRNQPLISVVVPVYNVEKCLEKCLNSIMFQTYANIEVIIIDDASTDGGGSLCDMYVTIDQRFNVIHFSENRGPSAARNEGIHRAKGEYITFIDADDYVELNFLERLYKNLVENRSDVSICGYDRIDYHKNTKVLKVKRAGTYSGMEAVRCAVQSKYFGFATWGKLYIIQIVRQNLFNEAIYLGEDILFFYQLGEQIKKVSYFPDVLYHYAYKSDSVVNGNFNERKSSVLLVYEYLYQDASKNFPELLFEIQRKALDVSIWLALQATVSQTLSRQEIFRYLRIFRENIRSYFSWKALVLCPLKKAIAVAILYHNTMAFWRVSTWYCRYIC